MLFFKGGLPSECSKALEGSHKILSMVEDDSWQQCQRSNYTGQSQLSRAEGNILERPLQPLSKVLGRKLNAEAQLLIYMGAVCLANFNFLFDQLPKGNNENPTIILNKMSFTCHETSISSQLFLCSDLK